MICFDLLFCLCFGFPDLPEIYELHLPLLRDRRPVLSAICFAIVCISDGYVISPVKIPRNTFWPVCNSLHSACKKLHKTPDFLDFGNENPCTIVCAYKKSMLNWNQRKVLRAPAVQKHERCSILAYCRKSLMKHFFCILQKLTLAKVCASHNSISHRVSQEPDYRRNSMRRFLLHISGK